jgi:hypothetical protein
MQLAAQHGASVVIMNPSRWRRILGAIHSCKLNFKDREDSKAAVQSLIKKLYKEMESASEDTCDAAGLGLAAVEWGDVYNNNLEEVRTANPKIRSGSRLAKLAEEKTEKYFDKLT